MAEDRRQTSDVRRKKDKSKIKVTDRDPKRLVKEDDDQTSDVRSQSSGSDDATEKVREKGPGPKAQGPRPSDSNADSEELEELKTQLLRVVADFDNFKRRTAEERQDMLDAARADLALQFIPVIDNFDRAASHVPKEVAGTDWYKGFEGIQKQFDQVLDALGIARIESVGQPFDPKKHEAVSHDPSDTYDKDVVSEEFEAGYTLGDSVIRPAKVNVSSGKEEK